MQRYPRKIFKPKKHKKVLPWQHLLPGVAEKLIGSSLCGGMENQEPIKIFVSQKQKKCCHGQIFKPKKHKKVLPWQHLLPGVSSYTYIQNLDEISQVIFSVLYGKITNVNSTGNFLICASLRSP